MSSCPTEPLGPGLAAAPATDLTSRHPAFAPALLVNAPTAAGQGGPVRRAGGFTRGRGAASGQISWGARTFSTGCLEVHSDRVLLLDCSSAHHLDCPGRRRGSYCLQPPLAPRRCHRRTPADRRRRRAPTTALPRSRSSCTSLPARDSAPNDFRSASGRSLPSADPWRSRIACSTRSR
jgi:hypothetical protein